MIADFLMLAKYVEQNKDQTVNIMGGNITNIAADEVPALVPFLFVVTRATLQDHDYDKDHELSLRIFMPTGDPLTDEIALREFSTPTIGEGMIASFVFSVQLLNCAFPVFGRYEIVLSLDGEVAKKTFFRIGRPDQDPARAEMPPAPILHAIKGKINASEA